MSDVRIQIDTAQIGAVADAIPGAVLEGMRKGMDRGNLQALGEIIGNRFTGAGPFPPSKNRLGVDTGLLRRSLRANSATIVGKTVRSSIGSNVKYFGVHEFGYSGQVKVKAHTRRQGDGDKTVKIRAHERQMEVTARRPLKTGIDESSDIYQAAISRAIGQEISKGT